jgi:hypothetical protein
VDQYLVEIQNQRNTLVRTGTLTVGVAGVLTPTGRTCQFRLPEVEGNLEGEMIRGNSQVSNIEQGQHKSLLDYLIPQAHAGNSNNLQGAIEVEADPWVCTIVSVDETEVTLDIPVLFPQVDTVPAGDGELPPLTDDCDLLVIEVPIDTIDNSIL